MVRRQQYLMKDYLPIPICLSSNIKMRLRKRLKQIPRLERLLNPNLMNYLQLILSIQVAGLPKIVLSRPFRHINIVRPWQDPLSCHHPIQSTTSHYNNLFPDLRLLQPLLTLPLSLPHHTLLQTLLQNHRQNSPEPIWLHLIIYTLDIQVTEHNCHSNTLHSMNLFGRCQL